MAEMSVWVVEITDSLTDGQNISLLCIYILYVFEYNPGQLIGIQYENTFKGDGKHLSEALVFVYMPQLKTRRKYREI